jgi:hypothetical protein
MADIVLKDGREITIDLDAITISEFRRLLDKDQPNDEEDAIFSKVTGIDVSVLPFNEYRRVTAAFFTKVKEPPDPN